MIATRIAETRVYLKRHGRRIAGVVPFGYMADPTTKQLVAIPKEARRVTSDFRSRREWADPRRNCLPHQPPQMADQDLVERSGEQRGGGKWTARLVLQLLRNPVYIGKHREGKRARPGCHSTIVDSELFDRVQSILDGRRTVTNPKRRSQSFPLRGKIICPKCRRPLSSQTGSTLRGGTLRLHHRYYCCRSHAGGRAPCTGVRYPAFDIEEMIRNLLADAAHWRSFLPADRAADAQTFASTWAALGRQVQDDLMPKVIDRVSFKRKNTELEMTFNPRLADAIMPENKPIPSK